MPETDHKSVDLGSMSREELLELAADIDDALATWTKRQSAKAFTEISEILDKYELTIEDVLGVDRAKRSGTVLPPKYRNPKDPSQTWTGKGRRPKWYLEALDAGVSPEDMRIG
jgi:DNA-binding protein H-NS